MNKKVNDKEGRYSFTHSLHLKIISGYALLIGLMVVIFFAIHYETKRLSLVRSGEQRREESRLLINRISGKLLDIAFPGELLPLWDENDFRRYHEDNRCALATLYELRDFYPDPCQSTRIDSISNLLVIRESYLRDLFALLNMNDSEGNRRIPITKAYADSLNQRNENQNNRLDTLIHAFEADAVAQMQTEQRCRDEIRQHFFHILFLIIVAAFVLATCFYILIHRDIRKKADYRRKLESANRDNRQLLDLHRRTLLSILHDLRSPLGVVSGYAELVKSEPDEQRRKAQTDNILTASAHMLSLTENLLEYYKLDTGGEQLSSSTFSLQKLARELEAAFRPMTENKGLGFIVHYPPEEIALKGDRERLYRIASNLLSNAIKFTVTGNVTVFMKYHYAVIMRFDSLREITASLQAEARKLCHLGISVMTSRSTLADANKRGPESVFEFIYRDLYSTYRTQLSSDSQSHKEAKWMKRLQIIDSTTITLFSNHLFKGVGRHPKTGKKKGGIKVHTVIQCQ